MQRVCTFNVVYRGTSRTRFELVIDGDVQGTISGSVEGYPLKTSPFFVALKEAVPFPVLRNVKDPDFQVWLIPGSSPESILYDESSGMFFYRDGKGTRLDAALYWAKRDTEMMQSWIGHITWGDTMDDLEIEFGDDPSVELIELSRRSILILEEGVTPTINIENPYAPLTKVREAVRRAQAVIADRGRR